MLQATKIKRARCVKITSERVYSTNKSRHLSSNKDKTSETRVRFS